MSAIKALQTSWNGGELSRRMESRVDTNIYALGSSELSNMVATVEGPAVKRPGFLYTDPADASATWLIPFIFNLTQSYVIECDDGAFRFFTNSGRIEAPPGTPFEAAVPYMAAEAPALQYQQSFDRLYLTHGSHAPAALSRLDAITFQHAALVLENGPFLDRNTDKTILVQASATTGVVTLTATCTPTPANANIWQPGHVGGLFRIEAKDFSDVTAWEPGYGPITIGSSKCRYQGNVYLATGATGDKDRTGTVPPTHTEGSEYDGIGGGLSDVNNNQGGGILWEWVHDLFGIIRIDTFISAHQVSGTVLRPIADNIVTENSYRWNQGAFSNAEGWPQSVCIWNSRLVFGKDFSIFGSVVGDYLNFADFTNSGQAAADLSFRYTLSSSDPILWLASDNNLILGTASAIYPVGSVNTAASPGPGNMGVQRPLAYGATATRPQQIGNFIQWVQRGGRKIREGQYDFARNGYVATNSTVWCRHLTKGGIVQLAYGQEPEEITWAVRADGTIIAHPFSPEQEVKGWSPITLGGGALALSGISIPSVDGTTDVLWLLVQRDGKREIWRQSSWWEEGDDVRTAFFVDGGLQRQFDAPTTHLSGLGHLADEAVWILADGAMFTGVVEADGTLDLPRAKTYVSIGLPYFARVTSMRPPQTQGKLQVVKKIFLRLIDTLALYAGGPDRNLDPLFQRNTTDPMNGALQVFNGDTSDIPIPASWERNGQVTIESQGPFPWIMTARLARVETGG